MGIADLIFRLDETLVTSRALTFTQVNPYFVRADVEYDGYRAALAPFVLLALPKPGCVDVGPCPSYLGQRIAQMTIGTVKFFNADKGYGFIAPEGGGGDAFVHISAVERAGMHTLDKDQRVSYDLETDNRGKTSAVNLSAA